jgi:hypothetical protein
VCKTVAPPIELIPLYYTINYNIKISREKYLIYNYQNNIVYDKYVI